MTDFDPNAAAPEESGIFGLPTEENQSKLVYIPVPWEVTTSYGGGTSQGPRAILEASKQVDLYDIDVVKPYEVGLYMQEESSEILAWNHEGRELAFQILESLEQVASNPVLQQNLKRVNELGHLLNQEVYSKTKNILDSQRFVGIVGGDHAVPFGALQAIAEKYPTFGILHFDAHSDTRRAYEGFTWSHASIMFNVLENIPQVSKLIQVGIRDFCEEEMNTIRKQGNRMNVFFDRDLAKRKFEGETWRQITDSIVAQLPQEVWISFDIDGLDPRFCPNTGTPVPGGLDFQEANYILGAVVRSGRKIIGFDLNEVAPDLEQTHNEWDANVGARLLYKMSGWLLASQGLRKIQP